MKYIFHCLHIYYILSRENSLQFYRVNQNRMSTTKHFSYDLRKPQRFYFWDTTQSNARKQNEAASLFNPEDGVDIFLCHVGSLSMTTWP
jgi:hypothetical protein